MYPPPAYLTTRKERTSLNEMELNIGKGVDFISIAEPKFKTNTIEMIFMMPAGKAHNSAYSLLQALLSSTSKAYPSINAMSRKLSSMYGASLKGGSGKHGDMMQITLSTCVIDNRYALNQEDLLAEATELLLGCLFAPNTENDAFSETDFRIEKQDLLDAIEAEINDKRSYALTRATAAAFDGEPYAYPTDGTKEDVEQLTPQSVYAVYRQLLEQAVVRIYHVGPAHAPQIGERLREAFAGIARNPVPLTFRSPSPCKDEIQHITEEIPVSQSKLVMVLKGDAPKKYAMNLMNVMFGSSPFSMLFMNVREKLSLCYYCSSRMAAVKKSLFVSSGVELENAQKTCDAILEQLEAIRKGEFTDDMLEDARRSLLNGLHGAGDTPMSCIVWSHHKYCDEQHDDIPAINEAYQKLTRQDVIDAANALRVDTIYLMQQEVTNEQNH